MASIGYVCISYPVSLYRERSVTTGHFVLISWKELVQLSDYYGITKIFMAFIRTFIRDGTQPIYVRSQYFSFCIHSHVALK
jgi:hypothetical protein